MSSGVPYERVPHAGIPDQRVPYQGVLEEIPMEFLRKSVLRSF
jgi:hypothetical protein